MSVIVSATVPVVAYNESPSIPAGACLDSFLGRCYVGPNWAQQSRSSESNEYKILFLKKFFACFDVADGSMHRYAGAGNE